MRWRRFADEKPAKEPWHEPIWVFGCDAGSECPEFLDELLYKPDYEMFFRLEVRSSCGEVNVVEKQIENVTHFAFKDDIILPEALDDTEKNRLR